MIAVSDERIAAQMSGMAMDDTPQIKKLMNLLSQTTPQITLARSVGVTTDTKHRRL